MALKSCIKWISRRNWVMASLFLNILVKFIGTIAYRSMAYLMNFMFRTMIDAVMIRIAIWFLVCRLKKVLQIMVMPVPIFTHFCFSKKVLLGSFHKKVNGGIFPFTNTISGANLFVGTYVRIDNDWGGYWRGYNDNNKSFHHWKWITFSSNKGCTRKKNSFFIMIYNIIGASVTYVLMKFIVKRENGFVNFTSMKPKNQQ